MSSLELRVTSLGVLPRLAFEQCDGDSAEKCMFQVVQGDPMQEMTSFGSLVFPARGGACPELCEPCVQRSSPHVPSKSLFSSCFLAGSSLGAYLTAKTMVEFISTNSCHKLPASWTKHCVILSSASSSHGLSLSWLALEERGMDCVFHLSPRFSH